MAKYEINVLCQKRRPHSHLFCIIILYPKPCSIYLRGTMCLKELKLCIIVGGYVLEGLKGTYLATESVWGTLNSTCNSNKYVLMQL